MASQVLTGVIHDLTTREDRGVHKYGTTLDRDDLSPTQRLQHFYEEMLDGAMYAKSLLIQLEVQGIELHDPRALAAREREVDGKGGGALTHEKKPALVADAPHNWTPITLAEAAWLSSIESTWVVRKRGAATA